MHPDIGVPFELKVFIIVSAIIVLISWAGSFYDFPRRKHEIKPKPRRSRH